MYFFRATRPSTILSICGCISGSPPGMETIGVPHSSTALKHSSGVKSVFKMCAGYWILPHPAQARLQRNSGSSISTNGYRFRPLSFCFRTYVATVHICETGTGIFPAYLQKWIGVYPDPQDLLVPRRPQAIILTETREFRAPAFTQMQGPVPSWHGKCIFAGDASAITNRLFDRPRRPRRPSRRRIEPYPRQRECGAYAPKKSPESFRRFRPL